MNDEKTLMQWFLELLQKLSDLFKGKEDNYADDNELLAGMAENDEEKEAIMQLCDEIDETLNVHDDLKAAYDKGEDVIEHRNEMLKALAEEQGEPIVDQDLKEFDEKEVENSAQRVHDQMMYEPENDKEADK
ncbi:MAG: hypothetical protein K6G25_02480 [Bacteroidales bacterium]|nr:hypothetical protein [Bacteroidales bacterium]